MEWGCLTMGLPSHARWVVFPAGPLDGCDERDPKYDFHRAARRTHLGEKTDHARLPAPLTPIPRTIGSCASPHPCNAKPHKAMKSQWVISAYSTFVESGPDSSVRCVELPIYCCEPGPRPIYRHSRNGFRDP